MLADIAPAKFPNKDPMAMGNSSLALILANAKKASPAPVVSLTCRVKAGVNSSSPWALIPSEPDDPRVNHPCSASKCVCSFSKR